MRGPATTREPVRYANLSLLPRADGEGWTHRFDVVRDRTAAVHVRVELGKETERELYGRYFDGRRISLVALDGQRDESSGGALSVELVPPGERSLNVRLPKTLATISFGTDAGSSSLAGDRLRHYERRPYEYIVVPANFPLRGQSTAAPEVLAFVFRFEDLKPDVAAAMQVPQEVVESRVIIGGPKPLTTELAQRMRRHMRAEIVSRDYLQALGFALIIEMMRLPPRQRATGRASSVRDHSSALRYRRSGASGL